MLDLAHNRLALVPGRPRRCTASRSCTSATTACSRVPRPCAGSRALRYLSLRRQRDRPCCPDGSASSSASSSCRAQGNRIAGLPEELGGLTALRELHLRANRLRTVRAGRRRALPRLRVLDLSRERPHERSPTQLADAPALEKLDLRWNDLPGAAAGRAGARGPRAASCCGEREDRPHAIDFPESTADLLDANVATLATVEPDGHPQLSEIWFLYDEGEIRLSLKHDAGARPRT
jgi:hypothetical protein